MNRLRAPRDNYAVLAEPPLSEVGSLLAGNRQLFQQDLNFLGVPWRELRQRAAQSALTAAANYMRSAGEPLPRFQDGPLLLAGHQPELFHPGVWIKNFALNRLAREHGAVPLNLVVDSDTAKSAAIHLPDGDHLTAVPYDRWQSDVPFEEHGVEDEELFATFPERTAQWSKTWPFVPMLPAFWRDALEQVRRTPLLGERLAAARRTWERAWNCHNFEVPLSRLCQTEPFAWFACHLLGDLAPFHAVYNQAVQEYRSRHGIRSRSHPVPDLATAADWFEAPFWIWRKGQTRRERLFARLSAAGLDLRCGSDMELSLPRPDVDPEQAAQRWLELERQGIKVRTRALTTTMFARMLVGDVFLHGIGGGKYDELTDVLIQRFYSVQPPRYLVLSATLRLPLPHSAVSEADVRKLAQQQRDAWWNPHRHFPDKIMEELIALKQQWIDRPCTTRAERQDRFRRLREITAQMRGLVENDYQRQTEALAESKRRLAVEQVLGRRDFAFCLFPEEELHQFMTHAKG